MRPRTLLVILVAFMPLAFLAGRLTSRSPSGPGGTGGRAVLYWVDPMNPSFRSPEPGTAPCGMPLEPVYADGAAPVGGASPPGAVSVRADRLQLIGVARDTARSRTLRHTLRLVGSVAPDETRLFRITAATAGRIREIGPATTGSLVAKGEVLGAYYTQEVAVPQQNYIRILKAYEALKKTGTNPHDNMQGGGQIAAYERNLHTTRQALMNLGMPSEQIDEIGRLGQPAPLVQIRAPAAGFVTSRGVSLGQSFEAGEGLYAIADLSRVWILADAFEGQERFFTPGTRAAVSLAGTGGTLAAEVSRVLPRFDPDTRTLKIRLEARNPGLLLRPDMFVDVELDVWLGPGIFVPKEAVLDSGTRRVVFVEQEPGVFVPRAVRTGRRLGEQVEIVGGIMEGETIVTSGNFLLDSESRMRAAGADAAGAAIDPVCGMEVAEGTARARGLVSEHGGKSWFFCTPGCKQTFDRDPANVAEKAEGAGRPAEPPAPMATGRDGEAVRAAPSTAHGDLPGDVNGALSGETREDAHGETHGDADGGAHGGMASPAAEPEEPGMPSTDRPQDASFKRDWAAGGQRMPAAVDPVCGMDVDEARALAAGLTSEFGGKTWFFCTPACKQEFEKDPGSHVQTGR